MLLSQWQNATLALNWFHVSCLILPVYSCFMSYLYYSTNIKLFVYKRSSVCYLLHLFRLYIGYKIYLFYNEKKHGDTKYV